MICLSLKFVFMRSIHGVVVYLFSLLYGQAIIFFLILLLTTQVFPVGVIHSAPVNTAVPFSQNVYVHFQVKCLCHLECLNLALGDISKFSQSSDLYSHAQGVRVPVAPPLAHIHCFPSSFISSFLLSVKWYLTVVSIFISLMPKEVEHLFIYLQATQNFFFMKSLFKTFAYWVVSFFSPVFNSPIYYTIPFFLFFAIHSPSSPYHKYPKTESECSQHIITLRA